MFYIMFNIYIFNLLKEPYAINSMAFTIVDFYVLFYHAFCWLYKVLKTY